MAESLKNDPESLRQAAIRRAHAREAKRALNKAKFISAKCAELGRKGAIARWSKHKLAQRNSSKPSNTGKV